LVDFTFFAEDGRLGIASLADGNGLRFDPEAFTFTAQIDNNEDVTIVADGVAFSLGPGEIGPPARVQIDIKLGIGPNCMNPRSRGRTPVAVLASEDFDPSIVDPETVRLEGVAPLRWSLNKDVNGDGWNDLVFKFKTQDLNDAGLLTDGNTLTLTGSLFDGIPFEGSDVVYLAGGPNCFDLFGVNSNDNGLSTTDPATGVATFIGLLDPDPDVFVTPIAMAVRPSDGKIFVWNNSDQVPGTTPPIPIPTGVLLTVDPATGLATRVDPTTPPQGTLDALAFAPDGRLFGVKTELFQIDPSTGERTLIGSLGSGLRVGGADFDPSGTLYGVELAALAPERLVTIDIGTGVATVVGTLNPDIFPLVGSIVFDATGTLIGSTTGPENPILFDIDLTTAAVSNVRPILGGFPPQGMGFAPEY
jgi:hypothetical protein